ncbi:hypothetical protein IQ270_23985 [Microcoleus sp. LEGE 07076]|nr:hypothetical protein [Microcoleus sp. LEGE 07076]MBE9187624.1 hypothetical protein [Microcoleus sp. LEGE 07076]
MKSSIARIHIIYYLETSAKSQEYGSAGIVPLKNYPQLWNVDRQIV